MSDKKYEMHLEDDVKIDKTEAISECLKKYPIVCLCGMSGIGKRTGVKMLIEKHPDWKTMECQADDLKRIIEESLSEDVCIYLVSLMNKKIRGDLAEFLQNFFISNNNGHRIIFITQSRVPDPLLPLMWQGLLQPVYAQSFFFSEEETRQYIKKRKSRLDYRQVYRLTYGWAGCISLMVNLQNDLERLWTPEELCSRYEIRYFIKNYVLKTLSEDEQNLLCRRASFPLLNSDLVSLIWDNPQRSLEEQLIIRGNILYIARKGCWFVHPVIRKSIDLAIEAENCKKAIQWYEENGFIKQAVECSTLLGDEAVEQCLIRNFYRLSFLTIEVTQGLRLNKNIPEMLYLYWMELYFSQDYIRMQEVFQKVRTYVTSGLKQGDCPKRWKEIFLNMAYIYPKISLTEWMVMLENIVKPGEKIRLFYILGDAFSYLSGIRDLSELFALSRGEQNHYRQIWKERLHEYCQIGYKLARLEYDFQLDCIKNKLPQLREIMAAIHGESSWQERLGKMYLLYLFADESDSYDRICPIMEKMCKELEEEPSEICRYNARALFYIAQAKWGNKQGIIQWLRENDGDIENEAGKTYIHRMAQVKIYMFMGDYRRADLLLDELIPYFEKIHGWKYLTETLFEKAIVEKEKGRTARAVMYLDKSFETAWPFRYVRIYAGYGEKGYELLKMYQQVANNNNENSSQKKVYKYGNVQKLDFEQWKDYIVRKAKHYRKRYGNGSNKGKDVLYIEQLTMTEQLVLQYLNQGKSNGDIAQEMNIKLTTVKTHIYNICKKLGVSTRGQAVQRAKTEGLL